MKKILIGANIENFFGDNNEKIYHYTRLDQTLFTALINTSFYDKKWMFIRDDIFDNDSYLTWYIHGSGQNLKVEKNTFVEPYFNNQKVETLNFF